MENTLLYQQAKQLLAGTDNPISALANVSALLYHSLENINWAGFYLRHGQRLELGPFQGKPACTAIDFAKGVCGTAAAQDRVLRVADVHQFEGHIACDSASASEIVLPLHHNGVVVGVLDIDSPGKDRFSAEDEAALAALAHLLEETIAWEKL